MKGFQFLSGLLCAALLAGAAAPAMAQITTGTVAGTVKDEQGLSPQNQTVRNSQFLANGDVDPARLRTTAAGFGAVNGAMDMRAIQLQVRFQF